MKKNIFCALAGVMGLAGAKTFLTDQESNTEALMIQNVEALSVGVDHEGGMANKHCPIWNITYETGFPIIIKITCNTGGSWKCENGKCPHE